jgi:hypothetical protein
MADIRLLERTLAENVTWNKARINFLSKFLIALIQVKTINLVQVATAFSGRAQIASNYKRVQRFLRLFEISYAEVAFFVVKLVRLPAPWAITLDRTDWYLGSTPLNIMTLGICYKGIAFPLLWTILEKKGCSSTPERISLMQEFDTFFGFTSISYLCADREFVGKKWLAYLCEKGIDFRIRLRANTLITNGCGKRVAARRLFESFRIGQAVVLKGARIVMRQNLYISGMKLRAGEYLIVASAHPTDQAIADYGRRWEIETLFGCMKSRGFCLEQTHVTDPERLRKLIALMALAFCWANIIGEWLIEHKPLKIKTHGRLARSIFRYGFDHLRRILCNLASPAQQIAFNQVIQLLSCT